VILLWGTLRDRPLALVREELLGMGATVFLLDQRSVLETRLEFAVGELVSGTIAVGTQCAALGAVDAVYVRPYDVRRLPVITEAGVMSPAWAHACAIDAAVNAWIEVASARIINRPSAMASNNSKPFQQRWARSAGFAIPETLLTTNPDQVRQFRARHGMIIYKSISGIRSIVRQVTDADLERIDAVRWCPTQFQQYIPGDDYRVHVVDEEVFACRIRSAAEDYRYAGTQGTAISIEACVLPDEIEARCFRLAAMLDLPVAGIDLRWTPSGVWFCFEVNPSPGFSFYQDATGQRVSRAVARALLSGVSGGRGSGSMRRADPEAGGHPGGHLDGSTTSEAENSACRIR
jgi:glutathione synthase/RimK-type ligase-like ATP-grasp enzyme